VVVGMVEVGDLDIKRRTDAPSVRWTITPPKHAVSGNGNSGVNSISCGIDSSGGDNAGGSDENVCYHCGIPGLSDLIEFTSHEQSKHKTECPKAQVQLQLI
jgi:hypothetical protein